MNRKNLVNELMYLGISFIIGVIIFKINFYKEDFVVVLRTVSTIFFMFVVPGYTVMVYWNDKLEFLERFVIGIVISAAVIGISSYYLGILGLHIKYHILLPLVIILASLFFNRKELL